MCIWCVKELFLLIIKKNNLVGSVGWLVSPPEDGHLHLLMHMYLKEIELLCSRESFEESAISDLKSPLNFQFKEKKFIQIGP